jgi:hypothetical protein
VVQQADWIGGAGSEKEVKGRHDWNVAVLSCCDVEICRRAARSLDEAVKTLACVQTLWSKTIPSTGYTLLCSPIDHVIWMSLNGAIIRYVRYAIVKSQIFMAR